MLCAGGVATCAGEVPGLCVLFSLWVQCVLLPPGDRAWLCCWRHGFAWFSRWGVGLSFSSLFLSVCSWAGAVVPMGAWPCLDCAFHGRSGALAGDVLPWSEHLGLRGPGFGCLRRTMGPPRLLVSPAQMRGPGLGLWICRRDNYLSDGLCSPACFACVCLGFSARPVGGLWCRSEHNDLSGLVPRVAGAMGSRCAVWCWARSGVVLPLGGVKMSAPSSCPVIFRRDNPLG